MELNKKKRYIIIIIITIIAILSLSTYAWLTYRTNDTAMVLTVGDINNVKITMSPYQINSKISPNVTYTGEPYTTVEVVNNSSSPRNIRLFYTINAIDSELATSSMKYTIEKKAVGSSSYTALTPYGNFNGATKGDEITIIEESAPVGTTMYKVYAWLQGASSAQNNVPGKQFNVELNAEIGENQYQVTFDADGGTVSPETMVVEYGSTYQNLPEPTRTGYTFLGWNGKNMFNKNANPYKDSIYLNGLTGEEVSNGEYSIYEMNILPNTSYVITNNGGCTAPGYAIYNSNGDMLSGNRYNNTRIIKFTTPSNASYIRFTVITIASKSDKETYQLEEGTTATAYEPYYITNGTTVVQDKNHTLTAIWQKNS